MTRIDAKPVNVLSRIAFGLVLAAIALSIVASRALSSPQEFVVTEEYLKEERVYSPYAGRNYPDRVLFGDTHLHTKLSPDAGLIGTTLGVSDAYRFARGEEVISNTGQPVQLIRPLDFLVVTDHSEYIGLAPMLRDANPLLLSTPEGRWLYDRFNAGPEGRLEAFTAILTDAATGNDRFGNPEMTRSIWTDFIQKTEAYNEPGRFTALAGFEWTSTPNGDNLHRVVILADGPERTSQIVPFSSFDSFDPEELWKWMASYESKTGGQAIAIPHNGNLSNGLMFNGKTFTGDPINRQYAEARMRWEPLHEVSQIKGTEETHPLLSPEDEFADFEIWDVANLDGSSPKTDDMLQYEYARSALKMGLKLGKDLGANPYKSGMSAASDSHTALATTREENYFGKYKKTEPSPDRFYYEVIPTDNPKLRIYTSQEGASGLTAVWARENTRSEIFGAMKRKEVYATTGTRIRVRLFAGWDFEAQEVDRPDFIDQGYRRGVPMGGDLRKAPGGKAPTFMVRALRDPDGANLDRIQIIKGWLDNKGKTHERIYDVAVSDGRKIDSDGRAKESVGNTVDVATATYTNTIGDALLLAYWKDPDFDPKQHAFYYVRVLEIPTPRWTTHDAAFYGIDLPKNVPATIQDRAYTSPIWYTP